MRQFFCTGMLVAALGGIFAGTAHGQDRVRIGVLNDQSGVFSTYQGIGSVIAAQMAVEDYGGKAAGKRIDVITADHQNKTDIGIGIARRWYDTESIDAIFDLPNSAIALAVANMSEQKNKVFIGSGAGTALLTGEKCTPNTVHWTYDTYAYGRGLGKAIVQQGGKKWFFITADYAFGHDLEKQAAEAVKAVAALKPPRVAYVSCDAPTLARDGKLLAAAGYKLVSATPMDLFPQTAHFEVVASFAR